MQMRSVHVQTIVVEMSTVPKTAREKYIYVAAEARPRATTSQNNTSRP